MQISFKFIDWKEPSTFLICLDKRHNVTDEEREQVKYWHDYIDRGKSHTPCTKNEVFPLNISSLIENFIFCEVLRTYKNSHT